MKEQENIPYLREDDLHNRQSLLKQCRKIWIEGFLQPSIRQGMFIDLPLQEQPDALTTNPRQCPVQEIEQPASPLPIDTRIGQIYDEAENKLLILGEPGSGKTTLLLELARTLLARAEEDEQFPMPIVLHLSSWTRKHHSLRTWLVEELHIKYHVPRQLGQGWIDTQQITPLLDGLDEVPTRARTSCAQAIAAYCHEPNQTVTSLVVCCRIQQYQALPLRLPLQRAVRILPLTHTQITLYLEQAGEQGKTLRHTLNEDRELRELASQPLMLNTFLVTSQEGLSRAMPAEQLRHAISDHYVDRMLHRRHQLKGYSREQARHWLMFLASQMRQHQHVSFSVEHIQPSWLPATQRMWYRWSIGLAQGFIIGPIFGATAWLLLGRGTGQATGLLISVGVGLLFALLVGWSFGWASRRQPVASRPWPMGPARSGFVMGGRNRSGEPLSRVPHEGIGRCVKQGVIVGLLTWMFAGLGIGILAGLRIGMLAGLGISLIVGLFSGLGACAQYVALRFWLWRVNSLPWKLLPFLDDVAERLLLRKVGSRYSFAHRLLFEYFVSLETQQTSPGGIKQAQRNAPSQ